jgi:hypothetical protein
MYNFKTHTKNDNQIQLWKQKFFQPILSQNPTDWRRGYLKSVYVYCECLVYML